MAEALERHLADDRDRRRVEEVGGLEAGEGGADDRPPVARRRRSATCRRCPCPGSWRRRCRRWGRRPRVASIPPPRPASSVLPTAATWGSVKVTRGEPMPFGDRLDLPAEGVLGGDPGLVLAHVGEERPAVDVADRVEPVAAADPQPVVGLEEAALAGLDPDRVEADRRRARLAADRDQQLGRLDAARRRRARPRRRRRSRRPARPGRRCGRRRRSSSRSDVGDLLAGEGLLARRAAARRPRPG